MNKIVTIHQPNYTPWIGLFSKIAQTNAFIIADNFRIGDGSFVNRNKIRVNTGWIYLTIPLSHDTRGLPINQIILPVDMTWRQQHWKAICSNYVKTAYFKDHKDYFEELYLKDIQYIWQLNIEIILHLLKSFNINVKIFKASEMLVDQNLRKTDMILSLLKNVGADTYLSGPSGRNYLEYEKFPQHKINMKIFNFKHPVYRQRYSGFEPNMSAIDLLFNMGPESIEIVKKAGSIEDP
jgi:hypothetical protein